MQGKKIDEAICKKVIDLWMNHNCTQHEIVERIGISTFSVRRIIAEYTSTGAHAPDKAVTAEPEQIEQVAEPVEMTEEHTGNTVPDAVMKAVIDKIETLSEILSDNLLTIKKMQQDNENLRSELAVLYGWRAEHEGAEN